ncbi:MAG TPA: DEAD/DEAH box helicase [Casimicrobium sp.]|nr:DEAD/DEAH box helicase [Casimicrobium sp.]
MTQNSNGGNAPRHPRSPFAKPAGRPQGGGSALFNTPPKKQANWLDDRSLSAPRQPAAAPFQAQQTLSRPAPAPLAARPAVAPSMNAAPQAAPTATTQPSAPTPATTDNGFAELGLRDELVRAVLAHGYSTPTPIQKQAIPAVLEGGDLLGGAQTGTGKTAGFVLPMLQRLMNSAKPERPPVNGQRGKRLPRALILAPTRELAAQVEESVRIYGKFLPLTSTCIFGGVGINPQIAALRHGVDIIVATPGRLLDLFGQRAVDFSQIEILVLDEADRMLDMGFIHDIKKVLAVLPPKRQNLLFSATFSDEIKALTDRLLNNPLMIEVARRNTTIEVVQQSVVLVDKANKAKLLVHLIREQNWTQTLVFTRTKHGANRLAEQLEKSGISAMAIHGNKSQGARTKALAEFKAGSLRALVATDIAARGIDIDQLPQVVNYELPNVPEDYVHRIGRTGRAGASGQAMSLVMQEELPLLKDIERFSKQVIPRVKIDSFNPAAIGELVSTTADARDAEWQARGGRPAPRGGRPSGGGGGGRAPGGAPRGRAPSGGGGGASNGQAPRPRTGGGGRGR